MLKTPFVKLPSFKLILDSFEIGIRNHEPPKRFHSLKSLGYYSTVNLNIKTVIT